MRYTPQQRLQALLYRIFENCQRTNVNQKNKRTNVGTDYQPNHLFLMKNIKSNVYTPNEVELAHQLADALNDQMSLAFYLSCTKKYPKDYLLGALVHVMGLPDRAIRTTRARLFTNIITNSVYNTHDHSWD